MLPGRWFNPAWLERLNAKGAVSGKPVPLLPFEVTSVEETSVTHSRVAVSQGRFSFGTGFRWRLKRTMSSEPKVNGEVITNRVLDDGDRIVLAGRQAGRKPKPLLLRFHERLAPELDAGWNALLEDPEDDLRWKVQVDALLEANHPLGEWMVAEELKAAPDARYGFKRSLSSIASSTMSARSLINALSDPFAVFVRTLEIRVFGHDAKEVQALVKDATAVVRESKQRSLREITWAIAGPWPVELPEDLPGVRSVRR